MEYEHHIFVSYARGDLWTPWVREKFIPRLAFYLQSDVKPLDVFVDDQLEPGARWDAVLKRKVARSSLMLSLISAAYFHSEWCRREMALMLEREERLGMGGRDDNYGLLIPIRIGDGLCFPEVIQRVQFHDLQEYADPDLPRGSSRASDFNRSMRKLVATIGRTLPRVPAFDVAWQNLTGDAFFSKLAAKPQAAPKPPRPSL